ncbi:MAG TPA: BON domain-containing protein [Pirellulales bacterium]|jgi:osmotically-inducible protein OsmY|nr:BON domain-containing protein [Pirellulales bacterium]
MDKLSHDSAAFDRFSATPKADLRALALRIKRTVRHETNGGVQELDVRIDSAGIFLRGRCGSFYCKQLAQTAAMRLCGGASVINEIEVAVAEENGDAQRGDHCH